MIYCYAGAHGLWHLHLARLRARLFSKFRINLADSNRNQHTYTCACPGTYVICFGGIERNGFESTCLQSKNVL